jgi:hypothetical protein
VVITPLTLAFSPFDTPNPNPTNRQQITALHTTIDFDVRIMLVVLPSISLCAAQRSETLPPRFHSFDLVTLVD